MYNKLCPNCKTDITHEPLGSYLNKYTRCGSPIVRCRLCDTMLETTYKYYKHMNFVNKIYFWWIYFLQQFIFVFGGFMASYAFFFVEAWDYNIIVNSLMGLLTLVWGIYNLAKTIMMPFDLKKLEKEVEKNKGYVWDDYKTTFFEW
jgi:hypothetical protein